jgi:L-seryl-tRNA(Ser) seleniumtransferase
VSQKMSRRHNAPRDLPSVDTLLNQPETQTLRMQYGRALTVEALRQALENVREKLRRGQNGSMVDAETLIKNAAQILGEWLSPSLRRVINATGVIVHTNLGRAPLCETAMEAIGEVGRGYSTLEYDLETGKRGSRHQHAESLLKQVTGAEAAMVVNNNAAAVLLALTALAGRTEGNPNGHGALISRGQLVEIGGGFRIPDVMAQSGARLVEVGTTNRTHRDDYENAIGDDTALILRVHRSNFAIVGFTTEPTLAELAEIAHKHDLLVVDDLGSGALLDTSEFGLAPEPTVQASLKAGADVVQFSGDKLLGGPQAGILVGKLEIIEQLRHHPLARAMRADKLCLAALAATLTHYLKGDALENIPVWQMISQPADMIQRRASAWKNQLAKAGLNVEIIDGQSAVGGGSLPGETLPTTLLAVDVPSSDQAAALLRRGDPPVIARIEEDRLIIDPRTVLPSDEGELLSALQALVSR